MSIKELTKRQKTELKQRYYDEKLQEKENRTSSYYEMMIIDDLVSDEEIENEYGYITFVNDDFFTNDRNKNYD
ncbi:MAG: hypothetical protein J6D03_06150 [Clostridia bacterium]|nr:hypothetical protein [Clostridia bacterium]